MGRVGYAEVVKNDKDKNARFLAMGLIENYWLSGLKSETLSQKDERASEEKEMVKVLELASKDKSSLVSEDARRFLKRMK